MPLFYLYNYICNMQVDYIIVGLGLAGLAIAEELERNDKSYIIYTIPLF